MPEDPGVWAALLSDTIYAAALGDGDWSAAMSLLQVATGARFVAMMSRIPGSDLPRMDAVVSDDVNSLESMLSGYTNEFYEYDPTPGLVADWPVGRWFLDQNEISSAVRAKNVYYQEYLRPHGVNSWAGIFLQAGALPDTFLSFVCPDGNSIDEIKQGKINGVVPHFVRALKIQQQLENLKFKGALATGLLDSLQGPLFLLDETGFLLLDNAAGRALAAKQSHAVRFLNGRFTPKVPGWSPAHWAAALAIGTLVLRQADGTPLPLFLTPIPPHVELARHWQRPLVLLSAATSLSSAVRVKRLRVIYGLSPAEAQLAVSLACDGLSPEQCAQTRGVAVSTVRSQIKSIQTKLRVSRLSLVTRIVLSI